MRTSRGAGGNAEAGGPLCRSQKATGASLRPEDHAWAEREHLPMAQNLYCYKSVSVIIEDYPITFNWTTEKVETCDNGALCQESLLLIKSGTKTAILASKGCSSEGSQAITVIQHSPPPSIMVVSYSNYCDHSYCNNRETLPERWISEMIPAQNMSSTLRCPTCVALGSCLSSPLFPCPNETTQCYQGRLRVAGGDIHSTLEVKGCMSVPGCKLMSGIFTIGPIWVKEICPYQSLIQSRNVENGATTWLPISVGRLELLLLLLL
ncbi:PREDICTED: testis-expressed sequence 101 protein [Miniopterus natalensis]|uniref:testis-expressed sequence 101 protein n=1 Tax=Miniopterus natalensis TaxID=291302 RepID=UPI0007A6E343|nr:PREDICTED: testis-expressed sequence 101 protein [Miniopterus natalensis]